MSEFELMGGWKPLSAIELLRLVFSLKFAFLLLIMIDEQLKANLQVAII